MMLHDFPECRRFKRGAWGAPRGSPPKKGTDQFYRHDDEVYWMTVVFLMIYSAFDIKIEPENVFRQIKKKGSEHQQDRGAVRLMITWLTSSAGMKNERPQKRVWPSGSEHSADRPACVCVRARFSTEAVGSVTDRGETREALYLPQLLLGRLGTRSRIN